MAKLVSIITPCYNGERYLKPFLESVVAQTYRPIELLFVDDGSTDGTKEIFLMYKEHHEIKDVLTFEYIYEENAGQAAAINKALPLFHGEYLMWFDSDDILYPQNVDRKVTYLESHEEKGFVLCQGEIVDEHSPSVSLGKLKREHMAEPDTTLFRDLILAQNVVYCPGVIMVRRSTIIACIPTLEIIESRQGQNLQLMLPISYMAEVGYIDEALFRYVLHNDSHSHTERTYEQQIQRLEEFERIICETIARIPGIKKEHLTYWCNVTKERYTREKLQLSYRYHDTASRKGYLQDLRQIGAVKLTDYQILLFTLRTCVRIKHALGKLIKRS